MASLPAYVKVLASGYGESFDPSVERTEMERGVPKQRLLNSQVLQKLALSLFFRTPADISGFETWYFGELGRIGWFQMAHPRTGGTITARFEGGNIGTLSAQAPRFYLAKRDLVVEYLRS